MGRPKTGFDAKAYAKEYYQKSDPFVNKASWLWQNFKMTVEEYVRRLNAQHGVCACCGKPETKMLKDRPINLSVDHDHATGKNRALLCHRCNTALGLLNDDAQTIKFLLDYKISHQEAQPS